MFEASVFLAFDKVSWMCFDILQIITSLIVPNTKVSTLFYSLDRLNTSTESSSLFRIAYLALISCCARASHRIVFTAFSAQIKHFDFDIGYKN